MPGRGTDPGAGRLHPRAQPPDWDDRLRTCPAFAAKPPSWITLRPTRDERRALRDLKPSPIGPREPKLHFKQLVTMGSSHVRPHRCRRASSAGAGAPREVPRRSVRPDRGDQRHGVRPHRRRHRSLRPRRFRSGRSDAYHAVLRLRGRRHDGLWRPISDKQVQCWTSYDEQPLSSPLAQFTSVVVNHTGACGRTVDGKKLCFGQEPELPPDYARSPRPRTTARSTRRTT